MFSVQVHFFEFGHVNLFTERATLRAQVCAQWESKIGVSICMVILSPIPDAPASLVYRRGDGWNGLAE